MYLKRLDLQGFKSFPDKIKLEFNKGITMIVGPNGSGKSNISDAVRWVLGEQRAKSLRGDKMEDIIFAGTVSRKPLGFAEVAITLDNTDGKISSDYSEITVSRTVFRSGESKYMINGTQCRLKDVHELFMDTGIGREGYSIIGQGRIDEILSNKSEDRRHLFEEAAGIVKYRSRRLEATEKLKKERENLVRVNDIIRELENQIGPLSKQSETAKKYLALKEQLKKYEINNFYIQVKNIEKDVSKICESKNILAENSAHEKENHENTKILASKLKKKEEELSNKLEEVLAEISKSSEDQIKIENNINLLKEQMQFIDENIKRIDNENLARQKKIDANKNDETVLKSRLTAANVNCIRIDNMLKEKEEYFGKLSGALEKGEELIEKYKADAVEKIKKLTEIKSEIHGVETMLAQFEERRNQIEDESEFITSRSNDMNVRIMALEKIMLSDEALKKQLECEIDSIENEQKKCASFLEAKRKEYHEKSMTLNERKSRFRILNEMKNEHDGFFKSVKAILKLRDRNEINGVCGAFGEIIKVGAMYETAVESAVGGAIQNIVVETEFDGKTAIEYLKKNSLGRATFLPISVIKGKGLDGDRNFVLSFEGVYGVASELVEYDEKYKNIVSNILGRTIIVENMDFALAIAGKTGHKYKIVTLDGDVLNPGGTMTGGSAAKKNSNIFSRSREIDELKNEIEAIFKECQNIASETSAETEREGRLKAERSQKLEKIQEINVSFASKNQEATQLRQYILEQKQQIENSVKEKNTLENQIDEAKNDILEFKKNYDLTQNEMDNINKFLEKHQGTVQTDRAEREKILGEITELKVSLSGSGQEIKAVEGEIQRTLNQRTQISHEIEKANNEKCNYISNKNEKKSELENSKEKIESFSKMLKEFDVLKESILENVSGVRKEIVSNDEKRQTAYENINRIENEMFRLETKIERLEEERERIFSEIWEEYEITYQKAKEMFDESISEAKISDEMKSLRNRIKSLGNVNVNSIEEFKQINERYKFLTSQKDDIVNAEKKLGGIIDELSTLMEKQFKEQLTLISDNFNTVFREMFGGGKAYLSMSDDKNVLESGIDIIAQPPGKNLQNMMLLSGGERALTAIAILFSILKMKPSPFCILDEIEAALDDANIKRFAEYLKNFSGDTQFIVISHRKGTMEAADVMYGVTMQEHGVSKVISINFESMKGA